ncbi:MAG: hypothetical protein ACK4K9_09970 [Bacteroidia bacterium]
MDKNNDENNALSAKWFWIYVLVVVWLLVQIILYYIITQQYK